MKCRVLPRIFLLLREVPVAMCEFLQARIVDFPDSIPGLEELNVDITHSLETLGEGEENLVGKETPITHATPQYQFSLRKTNISSEPHRVV